MKTNDEEDDAFSAIGKCVMLGDGSWVEVDDDGRNDDCPDGT